ncbi:MAG: OmpA family protein [Deltaproteobacteria bacterium]|nr:OmpA family protein [Deltaproteobacteria bacterium]
MRVVLGGVVALAVLAAGCLTGPQVKSELRSVRVDIEKARASGAIRCSPRELALAEANADFADAELEQGNFMRANEHLSESQDNARRALENSKGCGPKRVLIKENEPPPPPLPPPPAPVEPPPPVVIKIEKTDQDGDGLTDDIDQCPTEPEDKDGFQDEDGCPEPDNDRDTVLDPEDNCPNVAGPPKNRGCPVTDRDGDGVPDDSDECPDEPGPKERKGCPARDTDNDGLLDEVDQCPSDPEDVDGFQDEDGCPDPDNDKDGLVDGVDNCPNDAGPASNNGCPVTDRDGDGILDDQDRCPDEPGIPEEQGCPKKYTLIVVTQEKIEIKQQVHFAKNKAKILPDSFELLAQVADAIKSAKLKKILIEGHTDSDGPDARNLRLSQSRADAVREHLIKKGGVGSDVLESIGFGETRPIASNKTAKGKALNRRVEFKIIER